MKKKPIYQFSAALMAAALFIFAGCQDKDYYDPTPNPVDGDEPSLLNYSTSQDVKLNATYDVPSIFVGVFDVYTQNPMVEVSTGQAYLNKELTPIAGGIHVGGKINLTKTVPATATELYIYSPDLFVPTLLHAKIEAGMANFSEVDLSTLSGGIAAETRALGAATPDGYLNDNYKVGNQPSLNSNHAPTYIDRTGSIPNDVISRITKAFPNNTKADVQYYEDALIELHKPAELWVSVIHSDGTYNSALSYFCFDGTKTELASATKEQLKEIVAFPRAKIGLGEGALRRGQYVRLLYFNGEEYIKKFPAGVTVGFALRAEGYDTNKSKLKAPDGIYYSYNAWNPEPAGYSKQHTIYFNAETDKDKDPFICFGFEDMANNPKYYNKDTKSYYAGDGDCNDVMFHVDIDPITAINPPPPVPVPGTTYHTETKKGVLSFEDSWPYKRDYDLNDVVVNYLSKTTFIQKTENNTPVGPINLLKVEDKITLVHSGGDFTSGFAYKVNIDPSFVEKVTIDGSVYKPKADGDGFIIKICDNIAHEVQSQNPSTHVYISTPKTYNVEILFAEGNGITQANFGNQKLGAPYNPYITPMNEYSTNGTAVEVHLPFYPPTDGADLGHLFGEVNDRSVPEKGIWYVGSIDNPYPFAVHLFNVDGYKKLPVEGKEINYTYPKFIDWVESHLTSSLDWFEYPANVD